MGSDRSPSALRVICVNVVLVAVVLILAEGFLQFTRPPIESSFEYDALLGWQPKLHFSGPASWAEGTALVRNNGQRMRESEDFPAETDAYRIAVVGDSMTWGDAVEEAQRYSELLQGALGSGFEVLNFGISGFGSGQELLRIERDVLPLHPDMIVVAFFVNDLVELRNERSQGIPKPRFILRDGELQRTGVPVPRLEGWDNPQREFKLLELLRWVLGPGQAPVDEGHRVTADGSFFRAHIEPFKSHQSEWLATSLQLNELLYAKMRELAEGHGAEFVVVEMPFKEYFLSDDVLEAEFGVTPDEVRLDRVGLRLREMSERLEFLYIDPHPLFRERGGFTNYFPEGPHLNPRGHETAAQAIFEGLVASKLIPTVGVPRWD